MSNTEKVDRLLAKIAVWRSELVDNHSVGATMEAIDIALDILRLGGERAVFTAGRVMAREMTAEDWALVRDAHHDIARRADQQVMTFAPGPMTIEGQGDAETPAE